MGGRVNRRDCAGSEIHGGDLIAALGKPERVVSASGAENEGPADRKLMKASKKGKK